MLSNSFRCISAQDIMHLEGKFYSENEEIETKSENTKVSFRKYQLRKILRTMRILLFYNLNKTKANEKASLEERITTKLLFLNLQENVKKYSSTHHT